MTFLAILFYAVSALMIFTAVRTVTAVTPASSMAVRTKWVP